MTPAQVIVDVERLDREVLAEVGAACARARAEVVPWRPASDPGVSPALLIGVLRRGERRIPAELIEAVARLDPDAGLLLVSDEPLVRPVVSTHEGRVTLLAQPASAARIRGTVRMLLAERGDFCRERLDPHRWTAVFEPDGGRPLPPGPLDTSAATNLAHRGQLTPPAIHQEGEGALTAVIPLIPGWSGAEPLCGDAHAIAEAHIDEEERLERLLELLGHAAGLVHLAAGCRQWTAYWPSTNSPLLLYSPLRLPRMCNLAEAASNRVLNLTATSGDLLVALSHELPIAQGGGLSLGDGGAAVVEQLEAQFAGIGMAADAGLAGHRAPPADAPGMPSGLAVEIR